MRLLRNLLLGCSLVLGGGIAVSQDMPSSCLIRNEGHTTAKIICADVVLRTVDGRLAAHIHEIASSLPSHKQERFKAALDDWLQLRDRCRDAECLKRFYKSSVPEWFAFLERLQKEEQA